MTIDRKLLALAGVMALSAAGLSGCGGGNSAPAGAMAPSALAGPDDPFWKAAFAPVSQASENGPGDLSFGYAGFGQPGALQFSKGLVLQTIPVRQPSGAEAYGPGGPETWADLLTLPKGVQVELRQVTTQASTPGVTASLCGAAPTTFVAVGVRPGLDHPGSVSIAAFSGPAPGPRADGSELCGVYDYALPG